jgi:hypothetical protein
VATDEDDTDEDDTDDDAVEEPEVDEGELPAMVVLAAPLEEPVPALAEVAAGAAAAFEVAVGPAAMAAARPATPTTLATPVAMRAPLAGWRRRPGLETGGVGMLACWARDLRPAWEPAPLLP